MIYKIQDTEFVERDKRFSPKRAISNAFCAVPEFREKCYAFDEIGRIMPIDFGSGFQYHLYEQRTQNC